MNGNAIHFGDVLSADDGALLRGVRRGIEKEGLRVQAGNGMLAQTPHPAALGSALTHSAITTDYSEALLEFITPASTDIRAPLRTLSELHRFTAQHLDDEVIWGASMPCILAGERGIPIARYGTSNVATMKRVYRNGLSARYGRMMQVISGIHYNFSMPASFWQQSWNRAGQPGTLKDFQTDGYLGLIRNFWRRVWLLVYLLGASPAVCASFLAGNRNHHLEPFDPMGNTLHLPYATSLRMGDLGYNSSAQTGMSVCYNRLDTYIDLLHRAIVTPHPDYADFPLTDEGELPQLNDALLQIENEFYSPIRPKRVTSSGEAPLVALQRGGIEYIEVRCVDVNPFLPLGIDEETMHLIDCFLLSCLCADDVPCSDEEKLRDQENLRRVVDTGRDPALMVFDSQGIEKPFNDVAAALLEDMDAAAARLDAAQGGSNNAAAIAMARDRLHDPESTPSGRVLSEMRDTGAAFWQIAHKYSTRWHEQFLAEPLAADITSALTAEAEDSIARQHAIEAGDNIDFATFLADFYRQYQKLQPPPETL